MKVKELIQQLSNMPQDADVVIFDFERNSYYADEDGSGEGVYGDFSITLNHDWKKQGKKQDIVSLDFKSDYEEIAKQVDVLEQMAMPKIVKDIKPMPLEEYPKIEL